MRNPIFIAILTIVFVCLETLANTITPYSSTDEKRRVFSVINKKYEDTRIDYNQDKKIDYWKIKKEKLTVEAYYLPSKVYLHIRKFDNLTVHERLVLIHDKKIKLLATKSRRQYVFNYSKNDIECSSRELKTLSSMLDDLKKTTVDLDLCIKKSLASDCYEVANSEFIDFIDQAVQNVFRAPSASPHITNKALSCLQDEKVKSIFQEKFGKDNGQLEYEKALIGVKNSILKFSKMPETNSEPFLQCKQTEESNPIPPMKTSEAGQILVNVKKDGAPYDLKSLESQLFHETLHGSSVSDESLARKITSLCYSSSPEEYKFVHDRGNSSELTQTTVESVVGGNLAQAEKNAVVIPVSVETVLPPSNTSPVDMNRVAAIESTERVQSISNSQTSGIVRMAENVLGATPAVAAPSTTGLASATSGSSSSRLPASTFKSSNSVPASKLLAKQNSNGLKPGEYIKEEIDLTKQTTASNTRVAANAGEKPTVAASVKNGPIAPTATDIPTTPEIASGSSGASPSGRSTGTSLSASSSTGSRSPQRGMASSGSAVTQAEFAKSKAGLVSQLSTTSDYRKTRSRLDNAEFAQNLKENSITVYNLQGKTWGAKKGDIIFLDQGDRFVREK